MWGIPCTSWPPLTLLPGATMPTVVFGVFGPRTHHQVCVHLQNSNVCMLPDPSGFRHLGHHTWGSAEWTERSRGGLRDAHSPGHRGFHRHHRKTLHTTPRFEGGENIEKYEYEWACSGQDLVFSALFNLFSSALYSILACVLNHWSGVWTNQFHPTI